MDSASEADGSGVEAAFNEMVGALKSGNLDGFYGAMHPAFTMIDEDSPFRMSKAEFQDHIGFHVSGIWEVLMEAVDVRVARIRFQRDDHRLRNLQASQETLASGSGI